MGGSLAIVESSGGHVCAKESMKLYHNKCSDMNEMSSLRLLTADKASIKAVG